MPPSSLRHWCRGGTGGGFGRPLCEATPYAVIKLEQVCSYDSRFHNANPFAATDSKGSGLVVASSVARHAGCKKGQRGNGK